MPIQVLFFTLQHDDVDFMNEFFRERCGVSFEVRGTCLLLIIRCGQLRLFLLVILMNETGVDVEGSSVYDAVSFCFWFADSSCPGS